MGKIMAKISWPSFLPAGGRGDMNEVKLFLLPCLVCSNSFFPLFWCAKFLYRKLEFQGVLSSTCNCLRWCPPPAERSWSQFTAGTVVYMPVTEAWLGETPLRSLASSGGSRSSHKSIFVRVAGREHELGCLLQPCSWPLTSLCSTSPFGGSLFFLCFIF